MVHRTFTFALAVTCLALAVALVWHRSKPAANIPPPPAPVNEGPDVLNRPVGDLKWDKVTLPDAIVRLSDITGANICAEWRMLEGIGVSGETTVSLHVANATLGQGAERAVVAQPAAEYQ